MKANLLQRPQRRIVPAFAAVLSVLLLFRLSGLRVSALGWRYDSESGRMSALAPVQAERIVLIGAEGGGAYVFSAELPVTLGDAECGASTYPGESVETLLRDLNLRTAPLECAVVELAEDGVRVYTASDFTYYETADEPAAHTTVYEENHTIPKGEQIVKTAGADGTRHVVYEVTYADGALLSRQAVEETDNTSVQEVVEVGTLVREAQSGDTVKKVIKEADGSGYLLMNSGDSLHFTGTAEMKCTAYTTGYDGVGTLTYTGTTVHVGSIAVDKSVLPLGTRLFVATKDGAYTYSGVAEDTGVRGSRLDLFMNSYDECILFGVRNAVAYLLDP